MANGVDVQITEDAVRGAQQMRETGLGGTAKVNLRTMPHLLAAADQADSRQAPPGEKRGFEQFKVSQTGTEKPVTFRDDIMSTASSRLQKRREVTLRMRDDDGVRLGEFERMLVSEDGQRIIDKLSRKEPLTEGEASFLSAIIGNEYLEKASVTGKRVEEGLTAEQLKDKHRHEAKVGNLFTGWWHRRQLGQYAGREARQVGESNEPRFSGEYIDKTGFADLSSEQQDADLKQLDTLVAGLAEGFGVQGLREGRIAPDLTRKSESMFVNYMVDRARLIVQQEYPQYRTLEDLQLNDRDAALAVIHQAMQEGFVYTASDLVLDMLQKEQPEVSREAIHAHSARLLKPEESRREEAVLRNKERAVKRAQERLDKLKAEDGWEDSDDLRTQRDALEAATRELTRAEEELARLKQEQGTGPGNLAAERAAVEIATRQQQEAQERLARLKGQGQGQGREAREVQAEKTAADRATEEYNDRRTEIASLKTQLATAEASLSTDEANYAQAQTENRVFKSSQAAEEKLVDAQIRRAETNVKNHTANVKNCQTIFDSYNGQTGKSVEAQRRDAQRNLEAAQRELDEAQTAYQRAIEERRQLSRRGAQLEADEAKAKKKLDETKRKITELRDEWDERVLNNPSDPTAGSHIVHHDIGKIRVLEATLSGLLSAKVTADDTLRTALEREITSAQSALDTATQAKATADTNLATGGTGRITTAQTEVNNKKTAKETAERALADARRKMIKTVERALVRAQQEQKDAQKALDEKRVTPEKKQMADGLHRWELTMDLEVYQEMKKYDIRATSEYSRERLADVRLNASGAIIGADLIRQHIFGVADSKEAWDARHGRDDPPSLYPPEWWADPKNRELARRMISNEAIARVIIDQFSISTTKTVEDASGTPRSYADILDGISAKRLDRDRIRGNLEKAREEKNTAQIALLEPQLTAAETALGQEEEHARPLLQALLPELQTRKVTRGQLGLMTEFIVREGQRSAQKGNPYLEVPDYYEGQEAEWTQETMGILEKGIGVANLVQFNRKGEMIERESQRAQAEKWKGLMSGLSWQGDLTGIEEEWITGITGNPPKTTLPLHCRIDQQYAADGTTTKVWVAADGALLRMLKQVRGNPNMPEGIRMLYDDNGNIDDEHWKEAESIGWVAINTERSRIDSPADLGAALLGLPWNERQQRLNATGQTLSVAVGGVETFRAVPGPTNNYEVSLNPADGEFYVQGLDRSGRPYGVPRTLQDFRANMRINYQTMMGVRRLTPADNAILDAEMEKLTNGIGQGALDIGLRIRTDMESIESFLAEVSSQAEGKLTAALADRLLTMPDDKRADVARSFRPFIHKVGSTNYQVSFDEQSGQFLIAKLSRGNVVRGSVQTVESYLDEKMAAAKAGKKLLSPAEQDTFNKENQPLLQHLGKEILQSMQK